MEGPESRLRSRFRQSREEDSCGCCVGFPRYPVQATAVISSLLRPSSTHRVLSSSPDNNLFGAGNDSDSVGSKGDGSSTAVRQVPAGGAVGGGGGLFEDEDDEDDFFSSQSQKKPGKSGTLPCSPFAEALVKCAALTLRFFPARQEKTRGKKAVDLFADDDEDGDIFSEKQSAPATSKKEAEKEQPKVAEKRVNIHVGEP